MDLTDIKHDFIKGGLNKSELDASPFSQFGIWLKQASEAGITPPNAMSLATADDNEIGIRTVLLKYFDTDGFVFFTNYNSKKSMQIGNNPKASLLFPWLALDRQVSIFGRVEKISKLESIKYFSRRSKNSQLGALASRQSSVISSRQMLLNQFETMKNKFAKGEVPLPDFWGGYRVIAQKIEFWQGRENRLHDRFIYQLEGNKWRVDRLAP